MAAKPPCAFGAKCYRKNPQHLANFSHPAETDAANREPTPVNSKAQSEPSPPPSHKAGALKRTALTVDEESEEKEEKKQQEDTAPAHQPPHTAGRIKRAKTTSSATTATKQHPPQHKRHYEDPTQSDEEDQPPHPPPTYHPLPTLNTLTPTQRQQYYATLWQSLYRLAFPDELWWFREFLLELHISRTGCELCSVGGVLDGGCVDGVMRLVPCVDGVAGVECCGVLDWMCGRFDECDRRRVKPWLHWRYFYDLPELMTVYRAVTTMENEEGREVQEEDEKAVEAAGGGWHCGYWRDAPEDEPPFLVSASNFHPVYTVQGRTIYHALHRHLLQLLNVSNKRDKGSEHSRLIQSTIDQLLAHASSHHLTLTNSSGQPQPPLRDKAYLAREKRVLASTFTTLGFVCPYNPTTQVGFRPLPIDPPQLRAMLDRMERERLGSGSSSGSSGSGGSGGGVGYGEWDGVVTLLSLAMDECDPGTVVLFYQLCYCCEGPYGDGVRVVEGEVSRGMGSGYEMTGGVGRVEGWKKCISQQMKYRYRRLLSQVEVAKKSGKVDREKH